MDNKKTAIYIRLSDEDNNVDGIVKAESNSVAAQRDYNIPTIESVTELLKGAKQ